jgi:hypothetical protein
MGVGRNLLGPGVAVQSGAPMRLALPILLLTGLLLAGCSSGEPSTFKAEPTAKCLSGKGYRVTTDDTEVGVIAANAPNGGLRANEPGNTLTIAFGQDSDDAIQIAAAFKRFAPKKLRPHILDVMRTQKNAVLLWTVTPPQEEQDKVFACLKG